MIGIVTRGDIVRVLARSDAEIATDVRHRLEIYGGTSRWEVHVREGVVQIVDVFGSEDDRHVAKLLALAVPGVLEANTMAATTSGTRADR